jgi:copper chaperone
MATTSLNVKGMSCNHCVNAIESALRELNGIQSAKVDLKANIVTVSFDDAVIGLETVKGAIEEAGYDVA